MARHSSKSHEIFCRHRHAGVVLPLFSAASEASWGIGEIPDLALLARWLRRARLDFLLVLPVNEMAPAHHSPYSTVTAMAVDPIFLRVSAIPEFAAIGGEAALPSDRRRALDAVRAAPAIDYAAIRELKDASLRAVFARFEEEHWQPQTARAKSFARFASRERWWLDDYTLFRVLRERFEDAPWWEWPAQLASRDRAALDEVRRSHESDLRYHAYLQWVAHDQWRAARRSAAPVQLLGDLPFMVGADSADVWANDESFARDLSVGTPPDAFSATGQDWGLPAYRWDAVVRDDFRWLRARARRGAELYDGYRVDHVIGFYRTWVRPSRGEAYFTPESEDDQKELGRRVLSLFIESGVCVIAEDLGTVPDFLRESLAELGVPGFKVLRWEREWEDPGQPFIDPRQYPAVSVATSGTHDTDTMADWWDTAPREEREALLEVPGLAGLSPDQPFGDGVRDTLLRQLYESGSNLLLLPLQDVFGWRDRINTPATVGQDNWTWRLPFPVEALVGRPDALERAAFLRKLAEATGRNSSHGRQTA